jgi:hypothetical protein
MTCSLDFVDSIASSPTVRLALADGATWILNRQETDFSPPPLREAVAQTLMADGGVVSASAYSFRTIRLGLYLGTATADATATALQALYRELDRPGNILRWWEHTTHPIFFRTYRASASSVRRLGAADGRRKKIEVELRAEYAGYGLLETPVSGVTVNTDPANGTNGCFVDVTGVKGDVESPAIIRWPSAAIADDRTVVFAVRRRGTPSAAPFLFQAEALTQGTDTSTQANDANFSGSGNNYSRCTFGTATMQNRLVLTDVGTASVDLRGTYRVYLRYRKNTSSDGINLQLRWGDVDGWVNIDNDAYATVNNTTITTADLGLVSIPVGDDPATDTDGTELVVSDSWRMVLRAERTSGSGTIDFDFLMLVPADDRLGLVQWNDDSSSPSDHWILRAEDWKASARDASSQVISAAPPAARAGGLPFLTPNQTNRIVMLRSVRAGDTWTLTTVSPVSVSYYPRYLTVRPAST